MKNFLIILLAFTLAACGSDEVSYPKLYTFSHLDQTEEGLFVLTNTTSAQALDLNSGTYGANREQIKFETEEFIKTIFDLHEIELLSENTARINFTSDEIVTDTVVSYTLEDKEIVINALTSTDLIYHDAENDQFVLCGFTLVAFPGPNVSNPGSNYNSLILEDCQDNADLSDHLDYVLDQNTYEALDTVGIMISKFIFK